MSFASKILAAGVAATLGLGGAAQGATISNYSAHTPFEYLTITDPNTLGVGTEGVDFNVKYDGWSELTAANYPGNGNFPGAGPWTNGPLAAQEGTHALAQAAALGKVAGAAYPGTGSIYFGSMVSDPNLFGGTLEIQESAALTDIATVQFDIGIAGAFGYSFYDPDIDPLVTGDELPVLVLTLADTTAVTLVADTADLLASINTSMTGPLGDPVVVEWHSLVWDVSSYDVASFAVQFSGVQHAQVYEMALYQSDYVAPTVVTPSVPEPASASLIALSGAALLMRRRRRSM